MSRHDGSRRAPKPAACGSRGLPARPARRRGLARRRTAALVVALLVCVGADRCVALSIEQQLHAAQQRVETSPNTADGYTRLAAAYLRQGRASGDFGFNVKAQESVQRALALAPDNIEALKLQATVLAAFHRFDEALAVAQRARSLRPQDHEVYSPLIDALVELGRYPEAVEAAQTMIDLHPDTAAYARVSYLRSLFGDSDGAIAAMRLAVQAANPQDPESLAWCRVHLGGELLQRGRRDEAEREFDEALAVFPEYPLALAAKARARAAAGDLLAAAGWYRRAQDRVPMPDTVIALGDVYAKLGRADEARRQYALLEFIERDPSIGTATYSRQLALFWADHDMHLEEALAMARRERAARGDIYAADVLAWCLFKNGKLDEAKQSMEEAMRLGSRDPRLLFHAETIRQSLARVSGPPLEDIVPAVTARSADECGWQSLSF